MLTLQTPNAFSIVVHCEVHIYHAAFQEHLQNFALVLLNKSYRYACTIARRKHGEYDLKQTSAAIFLSTRE